MELRSYQYFPENARMQINLDQRVSEILNSLDNFLIYLLKYKPRIFDEYLITLQNKLRSLLVKSDISIQNLYIPPVQEELKAFTEIRTLYLHMLCNS